MSASFRAFRKSHPPFVECKVLIIYEALLKPVGFVRTHRPHLVNRQLIKCLTSDTIIMQDASVAGLSRRHKKSIAQQLNVKLSN